MVQHRIRRASFELSGVEAYPMFVQRKLASMPFTLMSLFFVISRSCSTKLVLLA